MLIDEIELNLTSGWLWQDMNKTRHTLYIDNPAWTSQIVFRNFRLDDNQQWPILGIDRSTRAVYKDYRLCRVTDQDCIITIGNFIVILDFEEPRNSRENLIKDAYCRRVYLKEDLVKLAIE